MRPIARSFWIIYFWLYNEKDPPTEAYASTGGNIPSHSCRSGIDGSGGLTTPALENPCGIHCDTYPDCH